MEKLEFRKLRADEIELRVGATTESGFSLLLYKTARVDANILDETVGNFNWQKRFYQVKNTMICEVGIYSKEHNAFIFKGDAGDESNTEAIKGEASDSFKRAGFAWGIGRELYTSPFIWITKGVNDDPRKSRYQVQEIDYKDNEICKLVIVNEKTGQVVFSKGSKTNVSQTSDLTPQNKEVAPITEEQKKKLQDYVGNLTADKYKPFFEWLYRTYGENNVAYLNEEQAYDCIRKLKL